jgi:Transposase DDE domain group 1
VDRKKITAAFDGGRITSDAGVVLLGQAERRCGLAGKLAAVIADPRNPLLIYPSARQFLAHAHSRHRLRL